MTLKKKINYDVRLIAMQRKNRLHRHKPSALFHLLNRKTQTGEKCVPGFGGRSASGWAEEMADLEPRLRATLVVWHQHVCFCLKGFF